MKILFLSTWFPYPLSQGSKIRAYHLLKSLAGRHEVTLLSFRDTAIQPEWIAVIEGLGVRVRLIERDPFAAGGWRRLAGWFSPRPNAVVATYSREMAAAVDELAAAWQPDAVVALTFVTAAYALKARGACHVVDIDNLMARMMEEDFRKAKRLRERARRWLAWRKFLRYEKWLYRQFELCLAVSPADRKVLNEHYGLNLEQIAVAPNGAVFAAPAQPAAPPEPDSLVFNGALTYQANFEAVDYFLREVFPGVRRQIPTARLYVTGSTNGVALEKLPEREGVTFTGYLDDVKPRVGASWACVVPLWTGGGTRLKILEAMSLGVPVISTQKGAEGLNVRPGEDYLPAGSAAEFTAQCVRLLRDAALREQLAKNARAQVQTMYDWNKIERDFCASLEACRERFAHD